MTEDDDLDSFIAAMGMGTFPPLATPRTPQPLTDCEVAGVAPCRNCADLINEHESAR